MTLLLEDHSLDYISTIEKGYSCPADRPWLSCGDCQPCPYMRTKCIVYSAAGKKKAREWEEKRRKTLAETPLETLQARSLSENDTEPAEGFPPPKKADLGQSAEVKTTYVSSGGLLRPVWKREERRGRDVIAIVVVDVGGGYSYIVQAKIGSLVRAAFPHQVQARYPTVCAAQDAAIQQLHEWAKNAPQTKARLKRFDLSLCGQRELFPELESQA